MARSAAPLITIAGNGIAAQAMALAFARNNIPVTMIGDDERTVYGGIQLAPNAWAALEELGLRDTAAKKSQPLAMMRLLALDSGTSLVSLPLNDRPARTPYASMARADLSDVLANAASKTGLITLKKDRITDLEAQENKVRVTLKKGKPFLTDWLFGCDGQNGICRQHIEAGDHTAPIHRRDALRLVVPGDMLARGGKATTVWLGKGGHVVHYPLPDGNLNLVAMVRPSPRSSEHAAGMLSRQPLLADLAGKMTEATPIPLYDHRLLGAWQRGRVVVAGDAAHPMPPHLAQGAGQSLVDAARLSHHLARLDGSDFQPAITTWCAERMRVIRQVSRDARRAGDMFALEGPMARLRNFGLSAVGDIGLGMTLDKIWSA